jgi:hypothetical protein
MFPSNFAYLISRKHGDWLDWPVFHTSAGQAVAAFSTYVRAERFYRCRCFDPDWTVGWMDQPGFLLWLRENQSRGVSQLLIDPAGDQQHEPAVPIAAMLAAALAGCPSCQRAN